MILAALYFLVLVGAAILLGLLWLAYKGLTYLWRRSVLRGIPAGLAYLWQQVFEGTNKNGGGEVEETTTK